MDKRGKWTGKDIEYLSNSYGKISLNEISSTLKRTKISVGKRARRLGLKSKKHANFHIHGNKLLNDELETLYWLGFIMADGTIENGVRLKLRLAAKDEEHLNKFAQFLNTKIILQNKQKSAKQNHQQQVKIDYSDNVIIPQLCKKYNLLPRKTYNPPDFKSYILSDKQWIALFIGYVDGDGNVRRRENVVELAVIVHKNWLESLKFLNTKIQEILNVKVKSIPKLNSRNQAYLGFSSNVVMRLATFIKENNIPALKRKWENI